MVEEVAKKVLSQTDQDFQYKEKTYSLIKYNLEPTYYSHAYVYFTFKEHPRHYLIIPC